MARRKRPAARDPETKKFITPWVYEDARGAMPIYDIDPYAPEPRAARLPGWLGKLGDLVERILGAGEPPEFDDWAPESWWQIIAGGVVLALTIWLFIVLVGVFQ